MTNKEKENTLVSIDKSLKHYDITRGIWTAIAIFCIFGGGELISIIHKYPTIIAIVTAISVYFAIDYNSSYKDLIERKTTLLHTQTISEDELLDKYLDKFDKSIQEQLNSITNFDELKQMIINSNDDSLDYLLDYIEEYNQISNDLNKPNITINNLLQYKIELEILLIHFNNIKLQTTIQIKIRAIEEQIKQLKQTKEQIEQPKPKIAIEESLLDRNLYDKLKIWRNETAKLQGYPPYAIFKNDTLKEITLEVPTNKDKLLNIKGIGKIKLEQYGDDILKIVHQYIDDNDCVLNYW